MNHTHTPKTTREILGNELYTCSCGARKWSNGRAIVGGTLDTDNWYTATEPVESKEQAARRHAIEMLETEGYGYDWNKQDKNDPLDSHDPRNQD